MTYTPANWYWIIAGSTTQVYSSAAAAFVAPTDTTYAAWLAAGRVATRIDSDASLIDVLSAAYPAGISAALSPTLAQQASAVLTLGLLVTSTATPALNGTYAADPATIAFVNSEVSAILLDGTFADGTTAIEWPDVSNALHSFTIAQFKALASALGVFVSGCRKCIIGAAGATLPSATATIA